MIDPTETLTMPDDDSSKQALRQELERLSKYDGKLRRMLALNAPLTRDTYIVLSGLDPDDVGAEQGANFPRPFQRGSDD